MNRHDLDLIEIGEKAGAAKERERIVKWLRSMARPETNWPQHLAERIERGEHNHD